MTEAISSGTPNNGQGTPKPITQPQTQQTMDDSKTKVHLRLHGGRTTMTVRILPELKQGFTNRTRQLGLSTCHVTEGLVSAWLYAVEHNSDLVHQGLTMNLTLVRETKRPRRVARAEEVVEACVCGRAAFAVGTREDNSRICLCRVHFDKEKPKLKGWTVCE